MTATGVRTLDPAFETARERRAEGLMREHDRVEACRTVFRVLPEKVLGGEIEDAKRILPEPIRDLWP